jgi:hypothetical protein
MKHSTLVLGIIAAGSVSAAIYLGAQLDSARAELEQETLARAADQAHIQQLEADKRQLEDAMVLPPPPPPVKATGAPKPAHPLAAKQSEPVPPETMEPPDPRSNRPPWADNTPAGKAAWRQQSELRLRRTYADMPAELGLDTELANKLFDLLADSQVGTGNVLRGYNEDPAARRSLEAAEREQRNAAISSLLGPEKAAEFLAYENSMPARMQVNRIAENLAVSNVPLTDAQRQSLIKAVATEYEARPEPRQGDSNQDRNAYQISRLDWQADYSRRVQASIEPLLTSEQMARYREEAERQQARNAAARARAEARRNSAPKP